MKDKTKNAILGFGKEILDGVRADHYERLNQATDEEWCLGIEKAVLAMTESKVDDSQIIRMLQKYWDLRLSEAERFVKNFVDQ